MAYQNRNFPPKADQPMAEKYTDAEAYDRRGESSVLENYVLGLWQPFLKEIIGSLSSGKVVVDLGCGTCEYTRSAENAGKIYAVDISSEMLKVCRQKLINFNQAEIIRSNIEDFKMPNNESADLIITIGVWEYIDRVKLISKIKEISRPGSRVMVVFPNIYNDLNWMRSVARMKKVALRPGDIRKLFKKDFLLMESASFGTVSWVPKKLQFLALPVWKFADWLWKPFQKFLPLGINVYYLFERK